MPCSSPPLEPPALRASLLADLRERVFAPRPGWRIGAEAELLPLDAATFRRVPVEDGQGGGTLPMLRAHAREAGWVEDPAGHPPRFLTPGGGVVSYEPGGQIEYSSPPCGSVGELVRALHAAVLPLRRAAREWGILLEGVGIDPVDGEGEVALQLGAVRYRRMDEHFARLGTAGARMMRQTASLQVNLDWEYEPAQTWRLLSAAAPVLVATFANSPVYGGKPAGARSHRGRTWRELDPRRTGLPASGDDPAEGYLEFALNAHALLEPWRGGVPLTWGEWMRCGEMSADGWRLHLSTLFPEVRPRGFAEVRSIDALDPEWYAAPLVLLTGLVRHRESREAAAALLGEPDEALLARAGVAGLADPTLGLLARDLFTLGLEGAAALGVGVVDGASLEVAREFFCRYTRVERAPADDAAPWTALAPESRAVSGQV